MQRVHGSRDYGEGVFVKRLFGRILSMLLVSCLLVSVMPAAASETDAINLAGSRLSAEELTEGNLVYFGLASATVSEEEKVYTIPVYREGDIDTEASVEVHTNDLTSLYGKDYILEMAGVEETTGEKTLLEKYSTEEAEVGEELSVDVNVDDLIAESDGSTAITEDTADKPKSELATLKEEQTGEKTRELYDMDVQGVISSVVENVAPQALASIEASSETTLVFLPGESEKHVSFRILGDNISEGDEAFSITLCNGKNLTEYKVASVSVVIEDDEPTVYSEISFSKPRYTSKDGQAVITVKRKNAPYSIAEAFLYTCEGTAKAGVNYNEISEVIAFAPYETEKEIVIDVMGKGDFEVALSDFKASEEGEYIRASVVVNEKDSEIRLSAAEEAKSFNITIKDKAYRVEYTDVSDKTGAIYDDSYDPPVKVGDYYFANGFSYGHFEGHKPKGCGYRNSEFNQGSNTDMSENYGILRYYCTTTTKKGKAYCMLYDSQEGSQYKDTIPGIYYQYITPDWESTHDTYNGHLHMFKAESVKSVTPWSKEKEVTEQAFSRTRDNGSIAIGEFDSGVYSDSTINASVWAIDDEKHKTPKIRQKFYGVAAMYKKYEVSVGYPAEKTYITPTGSTNPTEAAQIQVKCGAHVLGQTGSRYFFANSNENDSNLVFTVSNSHVNGHEGKFAYIKGYKIKVGTGDKAVTLDYPSDFESYLNSKKGTNSGYIDYSSSNVQAEIEKVNNKLDTVPMDKYFIAWIEASQKSTDKEGLGYRQRVNFTPVYEYYNSDVTIRKPSVGTGRFADTSLVADQTVTFHAGDLINLETVCEDTVNYRADGYEVSVDGGINYNTIRDTKNLFIEANKQYVIRPSFTQKDNRIEIAYENETTKNHVSVEGVLPQDLISDNSELSGKTILDINPSASDVAGRMDPCVGAVYNIVFKVNEEAPEGKVNVIKVTDVYTGDVFYTAKTFSVYAKSRISDNILKIELLQVDESQIKPHQISGYITSEMIPIRSDGLETKSLPVTGVSAQVETFEKIDNNQIIRSGSTGKSGEYILTDALLYTGATKVRVTVSDGLMYNQLVDIPLAGAEKDGTVDVNASGILKLSYPVNAPDVYDVTYKYDKSTNNQKQDSTLNSVNIYDDTISITAYADLKNRQVEKAIFTVYTVTGEKTEYTAFPDELNAGRFTISIPKMLDELHNGDRVLVRLVDKETRMLIANNTVQNIPIEYPDKDTGLVFFTENELKVPQTFDVDKVASANIPMLGLTSGTTSSGLLAFSRTNWEGNTGYTLDFNITGSGNNKALSTNDKLKTLNGYRDEVGRIKNANKDLYAETINKKMILGTLQNVASDDEDENGVDSFEKERNTLSKQIEENNKVIKELEKGKGNKALAGLKGASGILTVKVGCLLRFDFIYNPVDNEYQFCYAGVSIGATVNYIKTFYTSIMYIPCFFNLNGTLQLNVLVDGTTESAQQSFTEGEFNSYSGNIATLLSGDYLKIVSSIMMKVVGQVGVGLCGILSVRGGMALQLQFNTTWTDSDQNGGIFGTEGLIGIDILVGSIEINVFSAMVGWGSLKGQTNVSFFGGLADPDNDVKPSLSSVPVKNESVLLAEYDDGTKVFYRDAVNGTEDMSDFGTYGASEENKNGVTMTVLKEDAAERARPQIISLGSGKKLLVFMGSAADNGHQLYYSTYDGNKWSTPAPVEGDGTFDSTPTVKRYKDKVIIAWADADKAFDDEMTSKEKLQSLGISYAVYDIATGQIERVQSIVSDKFLNQSPQIVVVNDDIYCTYMKRDIESVEKEDDMLNLTGLYSTMAYVKYNGDSGAQNEEKYVTIKHPVLTDPLVMDYTSESFKVNSEDFVAVTYTVDEDADLTTGADRSLWLVLENVTQGKLYYPMKITGSDESGSVPKLTKCGDSLYLTYIKNGYLFNLLDVTSLVLGLFFEDEGNGEEGEDAPKKADVSAYRNADGEDKNWYKKSAAELGIPEDVYSGTLFEQLNNNRFPTHETSLKLSEDATTATNNYKLAYNGNDIFLFFTDVSTVSTSELKIGNEVFAMKYELQSAQEDEEDVMGNSGFSAPVQLTEYGVTIDEFDLTIEDGEKFGIVANYFNQTFNDEGTIDFGANKIVTLDILPKEKPQILNNPSVKGNVIAGETVTVDFDVVNDGLKKAEYLKIDVIEHNNGTSNTLETIEINEDIKAKETRNVSFSWNVPENLENTQIEIVLYDINGNVYESYTKSIDSDAKVKITDSAIEWRGNKPYLNVTVSNIGANGSDNLYGKLASVDNKGNVINSYDDFEIPALKSGEQTHYEFELKPRSNDFSSFGIAEYKITVTDGENLIDDVTNTITSSKPVVAELDSGSESVTMEKGKTHNLTVTASPWNEIAGEVKYYSSDASVVSVDANGKLTAKGEGSAKVYAFYPDSLVTDEIEVFVNEKSSDTKSGGSAQRRYTVQFISNGGSRVNSINVVKGTAAAQPENPVKEGFVFDGWYTDQHFDVKYDFEAPVNSNIMLYAKWIEEKTEWNNPFEDVRENDWFYGDVAYTNQLGLMNGTSENLFSPNAPLTRAMLVTILYRSEGEPAVDEDAVFADVDMTSYYGKAVSWAKQNGIVNGVDENLFMPDNDITREQIAAIMHRYAKFKGYDVSVGEDADIQSFDDYDSVSEYAISSMKWAYASGLITGRSATTLNPSENATRAEMAAILRRFAERNSK